MRILSCAFLILALVSCTARESNHQESKQPPNIIIFLADDQGWAERYLFSHWRDQTSVRSQRSNRFPNDSFLTNWTSPEEKITWYVEVLADGAFEVVVYYTCSTEDVGSTFDLRFGDRVLVGQITESHDPPLIGMEHDRVERIESYVKDFKPLNLGTIDLKKGRGTLSLKALDVPGSHIMDFKLLMFRRIGPIETSAKG
jgi:hypothetical protein